MKRIDMTIALMLEMIGHPNLDSWLVRKLPPAHLAALSAEAKAHRERARVRVSKRKAKMAKALSALDAKSPAGRDILHLTPYII